MAKAAVKAAVKTEEDAVPDYWKGRVTVSKGERVKFQMLRWLAEAASKEANRYCMNGIFNECVDGHRVFVATDGRRLHKISYPADQDYFQDVPVGKLLAFKADAKEFVFTMEMTGKFPDYKRVIPDISCVEPFTIRLSKEYMNTEALFELYSRRIKVSARYVAGLATNDTDWAVYAGKGAVVFQQGDLSAMYTAVIAPMFVDE
jgi:hypothetical protein